MKVVNWAAIRDTAAAVVLVQIAIMIFIFSDGTRMGHFDAQRDIAYESIMSAWVADCDCTPDLDK